MKIGIITTTVRGNGQSSSVAKWLLDFATKRNDGNTYELVDLKDYDLPILGIEPTEDQGASIKAWSEKINELDGFVFAVAEYNHAPSGAIKNALDYLKPELKNKAAGLVGYGGVGAARAIEHMRGILAELGVATVQRNVNLLLAVDFENFQTFKPQDHHEPMLDEMFSQVSDWSKALKTLR